jgi:hypothetical protein
MDADHPPPGYHHTPIVLGTSQRTFHYNDCQYAPPSPPEGEIKGRATPSALPLSQGPLPLETLSFLTLNVQKTGSTNPSLSDIVSLLDLHTPDFLVLTETPSLPYNGALTQVLRNMEYNIHYNPVHAPTPPDTLPEARLPTHLTHSWGGLLTKNIWAGRNTSAPSGCPRIAHRQPRMQWTSIHLLFGKISSIHHRCTRRYIVKPGRRKILRETSMDNIAKLHIMQIRSNFLILYQNVFVNRNFVLSNIEEFLSRDR